jgi:hypothetical protein
LHCILFDPIFLFTHSCTIFDPKPRIDWLASSSPCCNIAPTRHLPIIYAYTVDMHNNIFSLIHP